MYPRDLVEGLRARLEPRPEVAVAPGDRLAAVLLPILASEEPSLVFTLRSDRLRRHPGEISFPGGMVEAGDADPAAAALREAHEELAIDPASVDLLGALPPVHTSVSAILVVPFVGVLEPVGRAYPFRPDPDEIAGVLEFRVEALRSAQQHVRWPLPGGHVYEGWAYALDGSTIWGATAAMLHGMLELSGAIADADTSRDGGGG